MEFDIEISKCQSQDEIGKAYADRSQTIRACYLSQGSMCFREAQRLEKSRPVSVHFEPLHSAVLQHRSQVIGHLTRRVSLGLISQQFWDLA